VNDERYDRLVERLRALKTVAVAFSGGSDSSFLLAAAQAAVGDRVLALTAVTPYMERQEVSEAVSLAASLQARHELVELPLPAGINTNPPDRCYRCKRSLYETLLEAAGNLGFPHLVDGTNVDDLRDYRPGLRALGELGIDSPLVACGIGKDLVRSLSRDLGLATWNKPTNACLLTRLPVGTRFTMQTLQRVEEAERFLRARGYNWVRVRAHGNLARIEVDPAQCTRLVGDAAEVIQTLLDLGFRYVTLDLAGYQLGSMNPEPARE
jgi:pyridinium-3,5-biscarboxylic acid mononucleotide sulfurtransferase